MNIPHTDFPFHEIDRGNPLTAELERGDSTQQAADALLRLLQWFWRGSDGKFPTGFARAANGALVKLVAVSALVRPELVGDRTYAELASELKISRASISHAAVQFEKQFGVHFRRSQRQSARDERSDVMSKKSKSK